MNSSMLDDVNNPVVNSAIARQLQLLAEQLGSAEHLPEQAFLLIGEKVWQGRRQSESLVRQAEAALLSTHGESAEQILARLRVLAEQAALWLAEARQQSRSICAALQGLDRDRAALSLPLRGLAKVVKTLQALRVATRIEAARSHAHGASVLGQELEKLGTLMRAKLEHINQRCEVLATLQSRAMFLEEQVQAGPLHAADGEIHQARTLLASMASQWVRTTDHAVEIRSCAAELDENIGEVVAALQFQDITRQRLQHVHQSLVELAERLASDPLSVESPVIGKLCQLQHDQLLLAVDEFGQALVRLEENLSGMAQGAQTLAASTCAALFSGNQEECARIALALQAVMGCLEAVQTTHVAAGQAIFAVCQAVRDVALLTGEIELLGEEMQLLAQNAAVSAAHGSAQSVGLTVIAANIQALAEEAGKQAVAMTACCQRVNLLAENLDLSDQQLKSREVNLGELLGEARPLIERMAAGGQLLDAGMASIGKGAADLGATMEMALAGLEVRRQFLIQVMPVLNRLRALAQEHGAAVCLDREEALVDGLRARYTMKSERDVHQRFLEQFEAVDEPASERAPLPATHGFLGSNVELF